jgi:hypothetical protein
MILHSVESLGRIKPTVRLLEESVKTFDGIRVQALSQLKQTLELLHAHQDKVLKMPPGPDAERYQAMIHYNLVRRNDDLERLITMTQAVAEVSDRMSNQVQDLERMIAVSRTTFCELDVILVPKK